jgi:hypothetical protein
VLTSEVINPGLAPRTRKRGVHDGLGALARDAAADDLRSAAGGRIGAVGLNSASRSRFRCSRFCWAGMVLWALPARMGPSDRLGRRVERPLDLSQFLLRVRGLSIGVSLIRVSQNHRSTHQTS